VRRLASALAALALGCGAPAPLPGPDVVAEIDGVEVRHAEFVAFVQRNLGEPGGGLESEVLSALFDDFVGEHLLVRLARSRQLVGVHARAAEAVETLLAAEGAPPPAPSAVAGYYAEHADDFRVPEKVELRVVRTDDRAAAERARRELAAGADFADVARRLSVDPTAELGGVQGELARDELPVELGDAVFRLRVGEVSQVLAGDAGFYVCRVERRIPARVRTLDETRDEVVRKLAGARADRALARLVAEARSRYAVRVYDRNLPFVYRGRLPVERPYEKH
jgi:hypothetical protein